MAHNNSSGDGSGGTPGPAINDNLRNGLTLLWQAYMYAQDAHLDVWDFALEIDALYATGLTVNDLRWLAVKGYVQHGQETSAYGDPHRSFRPSDGLNFIPETCFVLTPKGAELAEQVLKEAAAFD